MAEQDRKEELIVGLFDRGLLQFKVDRSDWLHLFSDEWSSHYLEHRSLLSVNKRHPVMSIGRQVRLLSMVVSTFGDMVRDNRVGEWPDHIYGVPESMTGLTPLVGSHLGLSVLWGRGRIKQHGGNQGRQRVVGDYHAGETVFMLDNAISTGQSASAEVTELNEEGMWVSGLAVLFDLERDGIAYVRDNQEIDSVAYFSLTEAVRMLRDNGRIDQSHIDAVNTSRAEAVDKNYPATSSTKFDSYQ